MSYLNHYLDQDIVELFKKRGVNLRDFDVDISNPAVHVEELVKSLQINMQYKVLFSKAGSHDEGEQKMIVNSLDPEYRQRFTIAHELAHNLYGHSGVRNRVTADQQLDDSEKEYLSNLIERQANNFAARLLMPEKLVREVEENLEDKGEINNDRQRVVKLAEAFNVSYISMEYRLKSIGN